MIQRGLTPAEFHEACILSVVDFLGGKAILYFWIYAVNQIPGPLRPGQGWQLSVR